MLSPNPLNVQIFLLLSNLSAPTCHQKEISWHKSCPLALPCPTPNTVPSLHPGLPPH